MLTVMRTELKRVFMNFGSPKNSKIGDNFLWLIMLGTELKKAFVGSNSQIISSILRN